MAEFAAMLVVAIVSLFQFPIYGAVVGDPWAKGRVTAVLTGTVLLHAIASGIAIYMKIAKV